MKVLVIPDVHLKHWMFDSAAKLMKTTGADKAVCLMDIPDEWRASMEPELYEDTFNRAIWFAQNYPDTLWCYGNHDLSYMWEQPESGFTPKAIPLVQSKMKELIGELPDSKQIAYVHRIDNVLFTHGGLTKVFVERFAPDVDYDDTDAVLDRINGMGMLEIWTDLSPVWHRPQVDILERYKSDELLQVVGHTPVEQITEGYNLISCDVFSTYRDRTPIGTEEFLLIDTETREFRGVDWRESLNK